ncbi:unnamed protein product, partial [Meganyctiphanes norvegica]
PVKMNAICISRLPARTYSSIRLTSQIYSSIKQNIFKTPVLHIQPVRQCTQVFKHRIIRPAEESLLNVTKDTLLYKNENSKYLKIMNIFAFSQFFFWSYLSSVAFTEIKSVEVSEEMKKNKDLPWWRKMDMGQYRYGM